MHAHRNSEESTSGAQPFADEFHRKDEGVSRETAVRIAGTEFGSVNTNEAYKSADFVMAHPTRRTELFSLAQPPRPSFFSGLVCLRGLSSCGCLQGVVRMLICRGLALVFLSLCCCCVILLLLLCLRMCHCVVMIFSKRTSWQYASRPQKQQRL